MKWLLQRLSAAVVGRLDGDPHAYRALIGWFWEDAVRPRRGIIAGAIAAEAVGLVCQLGGLLVIFRYANALARNEPLQLLGMALDPRKSLELLLLVSGGVLALLVAYSFLGYLARSITARARTAYEEECLRRAYVLTSHLPDPRAPEASEMVEDRRIRGGGTREARTMSRLLSTLIRAARPGISVVVFLLAMVFVSPIPSLLALLMGAAALGLLLRTNRATARRSHVSDHHRTRSAVERKSLMKEASAASRPLTTDAPELIDAFETGASREYLDVELELELVAERQAFILDLMTAVAIVGVVLVTGIGLISGHWSLVRLITFLLLLRYFLNSLRALGRFFAMVSSMYAALHRYHVLVVEVGPLVDAPVLAAEMEAAPVEVHA